MHATRPVGIALLLAALPATPTAQAFDHEWARFESAPHLLSAGVLSSTDIEVDFEWGDLDRDGWTDLVVVRKQPYTTPGKRQNVLLMNENGVLVDRTAQYAAASDVPGDQGFLTETSDRDVALADVDLDGWLDVVTSTAVGQGDPKAISHPRVYVNLGEDGGSWQGLRYEEARIPQIYASSGPILVAVAPNFNAVAVGDVTGDGAPDLYFVDHDEAPLGYMEPPGIDVDDRLFVNDGAGFFTDGTTLHLQSAMTEDAYGTSARIVDINQDGVNDVVRNAAQGFKETSISYNVPSDEGSFLIYDVAYEQEGYHVEHGDLNNDGRLDLVVADDFDDKYLFNEGNDVFGRVVWSPPRAFDFLVGGDDGYAGNVRIADLDRDGWEDVLICSVDVASDFDGRRAHLYHNLGGEVGSSSIVLREERQGLIEGHGHWLGAPGFEREDLEMVFDVAVFDIDGDGWEDLVVSRYGGTFVWRNRTGDIVCQPDLGSGGPGSAILSVCGDALATGGVADLRLEGAPVGTPVFHVVSFQSNPTPLFGGTLVPFPPDEILSGTTDADGVSVVNDIPGGGGPVAVYAQSAYLDSSLPGLVGLSNALRVEFLP